MPEPGLRPIRLIKEIRMKNFVLLLHLLASGCRSRNMKAKDSLRNHSRKHDGEVNNRHQLVYTGLHRSVQSKRFHRIHRYQFF